MKRICEFITFRFRTVKRCSWCKVLIGLRSRLLFRFRPGAPVTDGICRGCMDRFHKTLHKKNRQQSIYH